VPDDWEDKGYGAPDHPGGFAFFCDFVLAYAKQTKGTKLLFVDELDLLMTTGQYPRSAVALWQLGRKAEVDIYYIAGQASRLHNCMRAKTTEIITFNQADPDNVSYLVKNGISLDILAGLGEHGWYSKNLRTGETDSNIKTKTAHVPEPAKAVGTVAEIVKPATARAAKAAL
jgi:hypothetical protein